MPQRFRQHADPHASARTADEASRFVALVSVANQGIFTVAPQGGEERRRRTAMSRRRHGALAFIMMVGLAGVPAVLAAEAGPARCEEDRARSEPPTISSRFDLKEADEGGASFSEARARALSYCAGLACTVEGRSVARTASIYGVALLHRRYIAGFRCVPMEGGAAGSPVSAPVAYKLNDPSELDAALAKANAHCGMTHTKAELSDLQQKDGSLIATFACSS
jgi:hypothetical protein